MKESYSEGVAHHTGPESCAGIREDAGEALTGVCMGRELNRETDPIVGADILGRVWKATSGQPLCARLARTPRGRRPRARTETPRTGTGRSRLLALELAAKVRASNRQDTGAMYGGEKSDRPIVPEKLSNKGCGALQPAEGVEERGLTKGNGCSKTGSGHSAGLTCNMRCSRATGSNCSLIARRAALCVITQGRSPVR